MYYKNKFKVLDNKKGGKKFEIHKSGPFCYIQQEREFERGGKGKREYLFLPSLYILLLYILLFRSYAFVGKSWLVGFNLMREELYFKFMISLRTSIWMMGQWMRP